MAGRRVGAPGRAKASGRGDLPAQGGDLPPDGGPAVGDHVVILGRVHAVPVEGGLMPVELASGGFVWVMPAECETLTKEDLP